MSSYDQFRFTSNDALEEAVSGSISRREGYYAPTGSWHGTDEQHLPVYKTAPAELRTDTSVLRLAPWSDDFGRPENAIIDSYIANKLGASVYSVNMPGVDYIAWGDPAYAETQNLTREQHDDLASGSFQKVGDALFKAVLYAEEVLREDEVAEQAPKFAVISSSMAVASAGGVVRSAVESGHGDYIKGVAFGEGVSYRERNLGKLAWQFVRQGGQTESLAQNPERLRDADEGVRHWLGRVATGKQANIAYFSALAKGLFVHDLGDPDAISKAGLDIPVLVHSGSISRLSPIVHNQEIHTYLSGADVEVDRWLYQDVDHSYTMAIDSMVRSAQQLV